MADFNTEVYYGVKFFKDDIQNIEIKEFLPGTNKKICNVTLKNGCVIKLFDDNEGKNLERGAYVDLMQSARGASVFCNNLYNCSVYGVEGQQDNISLFDCSTSNLKLGKYSSSIDNDIAQVHNSVELRDDELLLYELNKGDKINGRVVETPAIENDAEIDENGNRHQK